MQELIDQEIGQTVLLGQISWLLAIQNLMFFDAISRVFEFLMVHEQLLDCFSSIVAIKRFILLISTMNEYSDSLELAVVKRVDSGLIQKLHVRGIAPFLLRDANL